MSLPEGAALEILGSLLQWSWKASLVAALVLVLQALAGSWLPARWRYALWSVVAIRLILPVVPVTDFGLLRVPAPAHAQAWLPALGALGSAPQEAVEIPLLTSPAVPWASALGSALLFVWALGAAVSALRFFHQRRVWNRRLAAARPIDDPTILALLAEGRRRLGIRRHVEIAASEAVPGAILWGLQRPRILLSSKLLGASPQQSLRHVVFHELAHLRQGDAWTHLGARALLAVHWFNPFLFWAYRRLQEDREQACDALALAALGSEQRRAYGRTLLSQSVLELPAALRATALGGSSFLSPSKRALRRRIAMIANFYQPRPAARLLLILALAVLGAVALTERPLGAEGAAAVPKAEAAGLEEQKETVASLRNVGTALISWLTDHPPEHAAKGGDGSGEVDWDDCKVLTAEQATEMLVDTYLPPSETGAPAEDGWGHSLEMCLDPTDPSLVLGIRSPGQDGTYEGQVYSPGPFCPADTGRDLVWVNGYFVTWPNRDAC